MRHPTKPKWTINTQASKDIIDYFNNISDNELKNISAVAADTVSKKIKRKRRKGTADQYIYLSAVLFLCFFLFHVLNLIIPIA